MGHVTTLVFHVCINVGGTAGNGKLLYEIHMDTNNAIPRYGETEKTVSSTWDFICPTLGYQVRVAQVALSLPP